MLNVYTRTDDMGTPRVWTDRDEPDRAILSWRVDTGGEVAIHGNLDDLEAMLAAALAAVREAAVVEADTHDEAEGVSWPVVFESDGSEWSAKLAAEAFIRDRGWSVGPSHRSGIRAVIFGDCAVAKWGNLTDEDRRATDAFLVGHDRNGDLMLVRDLADVTAWQNGTGGGPTDLAREQLDAKAESPLPRTLDAMAAEDAAECAGHDESARLCTSCGTCTCNRATDAETGEDAGIAEVRANCPLHGGERGPSDGNPPDLRLIEGAAPEPIERPPRHRPVAGLRVERRDWSSGDEPWRIVGPDGLEVGGGRTKAKAWEALGDLAWTLLQQAQRSVAA